jgi:hypothetical protein
MITTDQKVLGLDVSMYDIVPMAVLHSLSKLVDIALHKQRIKAIR